MNKDELRELYNDESMRLLGVTPTEEDVDKLYQTYLNAVDFTESDNDILFSLDENGELHTSFKPHKLFPETFPENS
ncbi:hypothetical protein DXX93_10385 [Thalassotalea euphylliae]|uniref:Uncharacterized protein n=1 Tax=Thalassotalea euphylliae TaxID=1655234 RepID=A0A3E0TQQ4_9GAMM|nr:hypothetical protein [Thalassotalea euphylliae]REL26936.1 hypothetical protein DXX93_10385 [Thalassotalea euphylliae]